MAMDANRMPVLFDKEIAWRMGGQYLITNGTMFEFESDEAVKDMELLSGRRLRLMRAYGDSPRVHGQKTLRIEFPRVDREFYEDMRRLQEFGDAVTLELKLLDADEPVAMFTSPVEWTGMDFYTPHRNVSNVRVFQADIDAQPIAFVEVTQGFEVDEREGCVQFAEARPAGERLYATYVWTPTVRVFELTPRDVPGEADSVYKPKLTLKEVV